MDLSEEKKLWRKGYKIVVGLDESGRGPLAGPVVAAAVLIDLRFKISDLRGIRDSKKLSQKKREKFYQLIIQNPNITWAIGRVGPRVIDRINIKNAAELAMERALRNLEKKIKKRADFLIIDGNHLKNLQLPTYQLKLLPKADVKVFSCMVAGIIAKVKRDDIMKREHKRYPQYGFDQNKGYPTKFHKIQIQKHGLSVLHRLTFSPCKNFV